MLRFASLAAVAALTSTLWSNEPGTQLVTIDQPSQSANIQHDGVGLAMRYRFVEGQMEVTATFHGAGKPHEVVMRMDDGQSLSFALPGHQRSLYSFARRGDALTARVESTGFSDDARAG